MKATKLFLTGVLFLIVFSACQKDVLVSATDPMPFPMDENKDLSTHPGDDFWQYCNGTWYANTPKPASGAVGGLYQQNALCDEISASLFSEVPSLRRFQQLMDAYSKRLTEQGYFGDEYDAQLRKFYESFADMWCMKYSDEKLNLILNSDTHSHCRIRTNGVVMNTDLWYELYDVDRNNILYLPPERRTRIW